MSRKTPSFFQLVTYIAREGRAEGDPILHNISADGRDPDKINRAFMQNATHCPTRKNGVVLYHEILSLSPDDRPHATPEILADLAERYLSLRAPGALAWGRVHFDENPHVHLVISGNLRSQKKKLRLSKKEFSTVKHELEIYQKERYPELSRSIVFGESGGKMREVKGKTGSESVARNPSGRGRDRRSDGQGRGVMGKKEILRQHVLDALTASTSPEAFAARLERQGITLYERSGRPAGVTSEGKKYRFRTLGLDTALESSRTRWERLPQRRNAIRDILAEKARSLLRGFGVPDRIREVLEGVGGGERERAGESPRLDTIRHSLREKRQRRSPDGLERER